MTFESARHSDFSPHVIFAVEWHRICDLRYVTFRSGEILARLWNHTEILHVHILIQTYLINEKFYLKKLQTWSKIQQLISINIWFTLSSASKLNHYQHFAIKYKFFKVTITIQI